MAFFFTQAHHAQDVGPLADLFFLFQLLLSINLSNNFDGARVLVLGILNQDVISYFVDLELNYPADLGLSEIH